MIVRVPPVVGGAAIVLLTCILSISSARTFEFQGANQTQRIRDLTAHISLNSSHPVVTIDFVGRRQTFVSHTVMRPLTSSAVSYGPIKIQFTGGGPPKSSRAVIFFNGHDSSDLKNLKAHMKTLDDNKNLTRVGLLGLGSESCQNEWLESWIRQKHHFKICFVFLIYGPSYDTNMTSPPLFHFPLGPSYYRRFPSITEFDPALADPINQKRKFLCSFIGTVYKESSSRQTVVGILQDPANSHWNCYLKYRVEWTAKETTDSKQDYLDSLKLSDYTVSPPGYNVESYRIYEAMTFGSVPILQYGVKRVTGDLQGDNYKCEDSFRLLKEHNAPVIWLDDWSELTDVLNRLQAETPEQTYQRRMNVMRWFHRYRAEIGAQIVEALKLMYY